MKLIVGLGNPGKKYERTRHNVGWTALDMLAEENTWATSTKAQAEYLKKEISGKQVELLKPNTFMNNSGLAVAYAVKKHALPLSSVIVIHDDKDIPLGETRVQRGRGAAGHNGVQSIVDHLGSNDFWRIRIGVAPTDQSIPDTADFVLGKFTKDEQQRLRPVLHNVIQEVTKLILE